MMILANFGEAPGYAAPVVHAPAFHCPACGGPQDQPGPGRCDFCSAVRIPLGTADPRTAKPCPDCASLVAEDHEFCPRCGAVQGEAGAPLGTSELACPGCADPLAVWGLDPRLAGARYRGSDPQILGCRACGGAWVDRATLDAIITEARAQAEYKRGDPVPRQTMAIAERIVYRPCPRCATPMNRRNFGRYSGIVVDECSGCGTYFDAGELEGVVAFVRRGGLAYAQQRDAEETRRDQAQRRTLPTSGSAHASVLDGEVVALSVGLEVDLLVGFLRWLGRWIRRAARIAR